MNIKKYQKDTVLEASRKRVEKVFDDFEKIYISFSGGKDSSVMTHLVMEEAKKRNKKVGLLIIDLEAQYKDTIIHIENMVNEYWDYIDLHWVCIPMLLRNAVSQFEPRWICWDEDKKTYGFVRSQYMRRIYLNMIFIYLKWNLRNSWYYLENGTLGMVNIKQQLALGLGLTRVCIDIGL